MKIKTLLTILCVCFSINLHSQEGEIIYTDFEPDTVLNLVYYANGIGRYLDINNDNKYEFILFLVLYLVYTHITRSPKPKTKARGRRPSLSGFPPSRPKRISFVPKLQNTHFSLYPKPKFLQFRKP